MSAHEDDASRSCPSCGITFDVHELLSKKCEAAMTDYTDEDLRLARVGVIALADEVVRSVAHHIIERDGWTPDDACYLKMLEEHVLKFAAFRAKARREPVFERYEVVHCEAPKDGKPSRYHIYGFRDGVRISLDKLYLRDHDEALKSEREACERIVEEVMRKAQDDSVFLGPAVTGWAGREILRRLRERAQ